MIFDPRISFGMILHGALTFLFIAIPLFVLIITSGRLGQKTLLISQEIRECLESMRNELRQSRDLSSRMVEIERRMASFEERLANVGR